MIDKLAKAAHRSQVAYKEALKTPEIMKGSHPVQSLENTNDSIGKRDTTCKDCKAKIYGKETPSTCCGKGKVCLDPFPRPPEALHRLWHENTVEGKLFRENTRPINNALCLTSIKVRTRDFVDSRFNPSIIFKGRATQRAGPLIAAEGDRPCSAQLLVHDPALQSSMRFQNMTIPKEILEELQVELQTHNPYVHDFQQVIEIPPENLQQGKIVISAKNRPIGEHIG